MEEIRTGSAWDLGSERHSSVGTTDGHSGKLARLRGMGLGQIREDVPVQQPAGRKCRVCGLPLSIYNPNDSCWSHGPQDDMPPIARGHVRRGRKAAGIARKRSRKHGTHEMYRHGCRCTACTEAVA